MDILQQAGKSVRRRGFLKDAQGDDFKDSVMMSQYARLVEEVGEVGRAMRKPDESVLTELADVVIVCAAIAELMGWNLAVAIADKCAMDEAERGHLHNGNGTPGMAWTEDGVGLHVDRS